MVEEQVMEETEPYFKGGVGGSDDRDENWKEV